MTHKTTMPEPVAYAIFAENGNIRIWSREPGGLPDTDSLGPTGHLITTDQAEAYKDACVREALEEAAGLADREHFGGQHDDDLGWTSCAAHISDAIRALIPTTK